MAKKRILDITRKEVTEKEYKEILQKRIRRAMREGFSKEGHEENLKIASHEINSELYSKEDEAVLLKTASEWLHKHNYAIDSEHNSDKNTTKIKLLLLSYEEISLLFMQFLSSEKKSSIKSQITELMKELQSGTAIAPFKYFNKNELCDFSGTELKITLTPDRKLIIEALENLKNTHSDVYSSISSSFFKLSDIIRKDHN